MHSTSQPAYRGMEVCFSNMFLSYKQNACSHTKNVCSYCNADEEVRQGIFSFRLEPADGYGKIQSRNGQFLSEWDLPKPQEKVK